MAPAERRALILLGGLALAGHLILGVVTAPGSPPGAVQLFDPATDGDPIAHRDRSLELARPLGPGERVDADRATAQELARLPGVGPALAARIVADREARGAFGHIAALDRVPGIGPAALERLAPRLTFSGRAADPSGAGGATLLDVNRATAAELDALPGIGAARARAIVAFRDSAGPFRDASALGRVPGLSAAVAARIAPLLAFR